MRVVRQIVYDFTNQEALDRQLSRSLADGVKDILQGTITVRTLWDERVVIDEFPDETNKAVEGS